MADKTCHNCGLPSYAVSTDGVTTQVRIVAESQYKRDRRISVWCCSETCALQARAQAEMGSATHKWRLNLAEFSQLEQKQSNRQK
jgi:hypothetical protein